MDSDKQKALDAALAQIDRAFGKGSAMRLGSREAIEIETISTGSLGLDIALGIGGLPRGRVVEIYGPESSGKTTLALHAVADAERDVEAERTRGDGLDLDRLARAQPHRAPLAERAVDLGKRRVERLLLVCVH